MAHRSCHIQGVGRRCLCNILRAVSLGTIIAALSLVFSIIALPRIQESNVASAWQVVDNPPTEDARIVGQEMEYLNHEFEGRGCGRLITKTLIWLTGEDDRRCIIPRKERERFRDLDLTGVVLTDLDLGGAELSGAILIDVDLSRTDLSNANLIEVDLEGAILHRTNLSGAELYLVKNLEQRQINVACTDDGRPPKNLPEAPERVDWKGGVCRR